MGEYEEKKRKRETNFSKNEQQVLISIVSKYSHIIEDKKTDRTSMDAKSKAWKDVEKEFNSSNPDGVFRSGGKLKKCFNNKKHDLRIIESEKSKMRYLQKEPDETYVDSELIRDFYEEEKKTLKKDWTEEKKYISQTGMGKLPTKKHNENEDLLLSIINKKTIYGLDIHPFDSDNQNRPIINNENVNIEYVYESDNEEVSIN